MVSPVNVFLSPTAATILPHFTSSTSSRLLACILSTRPSRSLRSLVEFKTCAPVRALPEYTLLTEIVQVSLGDEMQFQIDGRAGNNFAFTQFMENLEASLFISNVRLRSTEQVSEDSGGFNQAVVSFSLDAFYDRPPPELLETVPLFGLPSGEANASPAGS